MLEKNYKKLMSLAINETMTRPVFINKLEECKKNAGKGDPYVSFTLSDSNSSVKANYFQMQDTQCPATIEQLNNMGITEGMLVMAELEKNNKGFINVKSVGENTDQDVTLKDFAQKVEGSSEDRFKRIKDALISVRNERRYLYAEDGPGISDLGLEIYAENEEKIKWSAAAEIMHSEKAGGLLEHTEAMVEGAIALCDVYPDLDKELLVTAAALHDIGKIEELNTNSLGRADYSPKGILLGHVAMGYSYVDRKAHECPDKYPAERVLMLESVILSHHGEKEYGAPIEPVIKEAYMLYYLDQIDAKYHEMKKATEELKPGEVSANSNVLGIKHRIYRPIGEE